MEIHNWSLIASVSIAIAGWGVNSYLSRRHEIFKNRLDYRLDMLESYIAVLNDL